MTSSIFFESAFSRLEVKKWAERKRYTRWQHVGLSIRHTGSWYGWERGVGRYKNREINPNTKTQHRRTNFRPESKPNVLRSGQKTPRYPSRLSYTHSKGRKGTGFINLKTRKLHVYVRLCTLKQLQLTRTTGSAY